MAIVLAVLAPILGVVGVAILNAGESYRQATTRQLQETAQVVAQSVDSEIDATTRLIEGFAQVWRRGQDDGSRQLDLGVLANGEFALYPIVGNSIAGAERPDAAFMPVIEQAIQVETAVLSNIIMVGPEGSQMPRLVAALRQVAGDGTPEVAVLSASPVDMVRSLARQSETTISAVLAVTDGAGRIIGRSVDGERFVGRPVPDWAALQALGTDSGSFRAQTIEGNQIVFAFHSIPGTPGWMAVVGEPAAIFDARWQDPIKVMMIASGVTIIIALILAVLLTHQVLRPIGQLVRRAQAVTATDAEDGAAAVKVPPSFVAEFETLRERLDAADGILRNSLRESRLAERSARNSNEALLQAERLARIGSWTLELATGEFVCSEMLYELNGMDPNGPPLVPADLQRLLSPESNERVQAAIARCIETGESYGLEVDHLRADGHNFHALILGQRICDEDGRPLRLTGIVQDISERREVQARLAALADNLPSGVIFRLERNDNDAVRASYISAGIEALIGVSSGDITRDLSLFLDRVLPEDRAGLDMLFDDPHGPGQVLDYAFRVDTPTRGIIWMHIRAALRTLVDNHLVWDGIARDITGERMAADALHAAKEAAETAERSKSDFLATMSHEIRTPMNTVIGMTRLALRTELDAKQRSYLEKTNSAAAVLLGIINDILDFSKIEAGGLNLERAPFTLDSVLDSVSAVTHFRAEEKGLEIAFAVEPSVPPVLLGDALRVGQVLTNLVSNAVKFTGHGDILVSIRSRGIRDDGARRIEFSVKDTGIGLTQDQIAGLFRPFTQAETDTSRKYGGTGLGLAICKRLVEMMGGDIRVDSEPGVGSCFTFTAYFEVADASDIEPSAPKSSSHVRGRRILIVDDNQSAREALLEMVEGFGMQAQTATAGSEGLDLLRQAARQGVPFDMVLLDWRMPGMDGIETARQIRADLSLPDMPAVLMVTAHGHEVVVRAVQEIGLQGVLLKPVTQSVMFNTILGAFQPAATPDGTMATSAEITDVAEIKRALAGKQVLVVDDNALNREVATDFLELVGVRVTTAVNGLDAIATLERQDFDVVLMDMHMPEMNGLEAVREIRKRPHWAQLPVIALTAQARVEDHHASLEAGMTAHLTKPIDETDLYGTLLKVLGLTVKTSADAPGGGTAPTSDANWSPDMDGLLRRFGGNAGRVERLVGSFVRDFGNAPSQLQASMASADLSAIAELVHQIKGSVSYFGASGVAHIADTIERAARNGDASSVGAAMPEFVEQLTSCLDGLQNVLPKQAPVAGPNPSAAAEAIRLIETALPLVRAGEFSAREQLERLQAGLSGTTSRGIATQALEHFEDLDIKDAVVLLEQLRFELDEGWEPAA